MPESRMEMEIYTVVFAYLEEVMSCETTNRIESVAKG